MLHILWIDVKVVSQKPVDSHDRACVCNAAAAPGLVSPLAENRADGNFLAARLKKMIAAMAVGEKGSLT